MRNLPDKFEQSQINIWKHKLDEYCKSEVITNIRNQRNINFAHNQERLPYIPHYQSKNDAKQMLDNLTLLLDEITFSYNHQNACSILCTNYGIKKMFDNLQEYKNIKDVKQGSI